MANACLGRAAPTSKEPRPAGSGPVERSFDQSEPIMRIVQPCDDVHGPRNHGLDIVRAAAIASVMLYHASNLQLVPGSAPGIIGFGWMGVDLFFVLSGFLIGSQLLKPLASGLRPDYRRFFARRALRTLPAFLIVLQLYFAFPILRETPDIQPWWQFPTFTENLLFDASTSKAFDHVWSLCVEEQFYLIFPLVVAALATRPSERKIGGVILAVLVAGVAIRSTLWLAHEAKASSISSGKIDWHAYVTLIYYPTWSRLDGLLAGVSIALLKIFRPNAWKRFVARPNLLLAIGFAGILAAILVFSGAFGALASVAFGFPLLSLSIALIVAAATTGRAILGKYRIFGAQALATVAYSLYLSHKIAFHATLIWIAPSLGLTGGARFLLSIGVAIAFGALLFWTVERPFLKLRNRLGAKSTGPMGSSDRPALSRQVPLAGFYHSMPTSGAALPAKGR